MTYFLGVVSGLAVIWIANLFLPCNHICEDNTGEDLIHRVKCVKCGREMTFDEWMGF